MKVYNVNWLRVGSNGLVGFTTVLAGLNFAGLANDPLAFKAALFGALTQGLLAAALELKKQAGTTKGQLLLPTYTVF